MAGIYIHIPFCKKKCNYCNFYSSTLIKHEDEFIKAITNEIKLQKQFINEQVQTIYFGGGTPSILKTQSIEKILNAIHANFNISQNTEVTIEVNPDNITTNYIKDIVTIGINRISIGIQSLNDKELILLNRKHDSNQAINALNIIKNNGITNISADIIYGIPYSNLKTLEDNLNQIINLDIPHISAYALTIEDNTLLNKKIQQKKITTLDDDFLFEQYSLLCSFMKKNNYLHYEISNFAKEDFASKHNSNYWKNIPYLGLGPSAHSFNINNRFWNISDINKYIQALNQNIIPQTIESLSLTDKYNEFIMISLRTSFGLDLNKLKQNFGNNILAQFLENIKPYIENKSMLFNTQNNIIINESDLFHSDSIISNLFITS
ncbi:MAG: hypothetical protein A2X12_06885 [Bacteroidetes bacterium GWE2_29_8]|nr:MAG: hypothetical protein A2X12_06885 [Bacteroidetes bacterium GWE2_29_8]